MFYRDKGQVKNSYKVIELIHHKFVSDEPKAHWAGRYSVILSVLDPRKCKYLKDYSLYFEHAYITAYLAS